MDLIAQRRELSIDLAGVLRDLGQTRAAAAMQKASTWLDNAHLGTTDRRELTTHTVSHLTAEIVNLEMEAEALRVEIAQLDAELTAKG